MKVVWLCGIVLVLSGYRYVLPTFRDRWQIQSFALDYASVQKIVRCAGAPYQRLLGKPEFEWIRHRRDAVVTERYRIREEVSGEQWILRFEARAEDAAYRTAWAGSKGEFRMELGGRELEMDGMLGRDVGLGCVAEVARR